MVSGEGSLAWQSNQGSTIDSVVCWCYGKINVVRVDKDALKDALKGCTSLMMKCVLTCAW